MCTAKTKAMALLVAAVAGVACSTVGVTRIRAASPKPPSCEIDVYTAESEVGRPFEVVCLLDSRTGGSVFDDKTAAGAINNAKADACGCGADALIVAGADTEGPGMHGWGQGKALLKAIRYLPARAARQDSEGRKARPGNATVGISVNGAPTVAADAEVDGRTVEAVFLPGNNERIALKDCKLADDLHASCVGLKDRTLIRIEVFAGSSSLRN